MTEPLEIGTTRQLFIDDHIVESTEGVARRLHQPAKYAGNPVLSPLYPWEGRVALYGTVMRDPRDGTFRMWYQGYGGMGVPALDFDQTSSHWTGFDPRNLLYTIGYATSADGVFWERPNLGLVEYDGSRVNNLVLLDAAYANVIEDAREEDPERRYKSLFFEARDPAGTPNMGDGVSVAFSPDGVRWTKYAGNPVIRRSSDTHALLGWDERHGCFVGYCRPPVHEGNRTRRIGRAVSPDFVTWSDPEEVLQPDAQDPPGTEFYGMPVFIHEGLYLGQLLVLHAPPEEPQIRFAGRMDVQLTVSRDGVHWQRACDRQPFLPNGPPGSIDAGEIYAARAPVAVGDELWFYYSVCAQEHGITGRSGPICLAKLRRDGFVSLSAEADGGTVVTKPFRCEGGALYVNAAARGGSISVAVLGADGVQKPGLGRADCAVIDGDSVRQRVTWRQHVRLDELRGQAIRLKFSLDRARLYSFMQAGGSGEGAPADREPQGAAGR